MSTWWWILAYMCFPIVPLLFFVFILEFATRSWRSGHPYGLPCITRPRAAMTSCFRERLVRAPGSWTMILGLPKGQGLLVAHLLDSQAPGTSRPATRAMLLALWSIGGDDGSYPHQMLLLTHSVARGAWLHSTVCHPDELGGFMYWWPQRGILSRPPRGKALLRPTCWCHSASRSIATQSSLIVINSACLTFSAQSNQRPDNGRWRARRVLRLSYWMRWCLVARGAVL